MNWSLRRHYKWRGPEAMPKPTQSPGRPEDPTKPQWVLALNVRKLPRPPKPEKRPKGNAYTEDTLLSAPMKKMYSSLE